MKVVDLTKPEFIVFDLVAETKADLLNQMVRKLVEQGVLSNDAEVVEHLLEREKLMSTGIKDGFAIPHCFTGQLEESLLMIGVMKEPIDYQALDEKPVRFVFLLLGPQQSQGVHLKTLARLGRLMGKKDFFTLLSESDSPQKLYEALKIEEEKYSLED